MKKKKELELEYEREKVQAKLQADKVTQEVNLIRADAAQINSVAHIPTRHPRDIIVVDEEWFERRRKLNKGHQVWKF
jgi:hypothetical protein